VGVSTPLPTPRGVGVSGSLASPSSRGNTLLSVLAAWWMNVAMDGYLCVVLACEVSERCHFRRTVWRGCVEVSVNNLEAQAIFAQSSGLDQPAQHCTAPTRCWVNCGQSLVAASQPQPIELIQVDRPRRAASSLLLSILWVKIFRQLH